MDVVPQRADFKPGDVINGKYCVEKSLGEGAFGHVYKVAAPDGTIYAFKLLRLWDVPSDIRQPLIDRFDMEFKTGQIQSQYLVHSSDYGLALGNPFIVMEFCSGGDMTKYVGRPDADVARFAHNILHGLNDLHINGKVHRDLKPENVLFRADGTAVLTDFGISGDRNKRMTERNIFGKPYQIFGTYAYMPPEQVNRARGQATVLPTTDIFSFGVVIYQLLTGVLPFGPLEDQNDLVRYQKRGKAGDWDRFRLQTVPGGSDWIPMIEGCLQPDFKKRLQTAREVIRLLPQSAIRNQSYNPQQYESSQANEPIQRHTYGTQSLNPGISMSAPETPTSACLRVMQGEDYGRVYELTAVARELHRQMLTIGRNNTNVLPITELNSNYVSRFHCTIQSDANLVQWFLRDGQFRPEEQRWTPSTNGTYVGSKEITQDGFWLQTGDIVTIGDTKLRFEQH